MPEIAQAIYDHLATYRRRLYQFLAGDETALEGCTVVLRWYERTEASALSLEVRCGRCGNLHRPAARA